MADKKDRDKDTELSLKGCYGEQVTYEGLDSFLSDAFAANRDAELEYSDERFATCIWGHSGIGKCVSGDTLIKTNDGIQDIGSFFGGITKEGFYPAPDGMMADSSKGFAPVSKLYYSGIKKAIRVRTNFGRILTGSEIHPIAVLDDKGLGWRNLSKISVGDYVAIYGAGSNISDAVLPELPKGNIRSKVDFKIPKTMNPDLAYIIGAIIAEGNTRSHNDVSMCQSSSKPLAKDYVLKFKDVFGIAPSEDQDKRTEDTTQFRCHRTILRDWFEMIGVDHSYAREKSVPWSILSSSRKSQRSFISALCEGEGSNECAGIAISSASNLLLRQVSFMLLQWNIQSSLSSRIVNGKEYWSLLCGGENGRQLQHLIGFSRSSGKWMKEQKGNPNKGGFPTLWAVPFFKKMKESHFENGGKLSKKIIHTNPLNRLYNPKYLSETISEDTFSAWARHFDKADIGFFRYLGWLREFMFEKIVCVEEVGEIPLFDLTMATNEHEFIGGGFVCHNTAKVKQHCKKPLTWMNKEFPGYSVFDVPIAQFEEMGDLHGMPSRHIKVAKAGDGAPIETWVPEEVHQGWLADGWQIMPSAGVRTMYASPDWVPSQPGPSILLLDDWNRASVRIIKGIMQLLQNYGMVSWKLPLGCNIVLTANPDEQDYLVTSIDNAILTRIRSVTLKHDPKEWSVWATGAKLDSRGINWVLRYPEMMIGSERTNPRTLAQCFRDMKRVPDLSSKENVLRFRAMASSLLDDATVSSLIVFMEREVELIIEPEQILAGHDWKWMQEHISKLMGGREKRVDILGIMCDRLFAHMIQPGTQPTTSAIENFQKFVTIPDITEDLRHNLCLRLSRVKDGGKTHKWILHNKKLTDLILSVV